MCVGCVSLKVASELLHATSGPVEAVESSLDQRRHDAAHVHLVAAAVLTVVLHPQPGARWVGVRGWNGGERLKNAANFSTQSREMTELVTSLW